MWIIISKYTFLFHNRKNSKIISTQSSLWSSSEGNLFLVEPPISTIKMRLSLWHEYRFMANFDRTFIGNWCYWLLKSWFLVTNRMYQIRGPVLEVYTLKCHTTSLSKNVRGFAIVVRGIRLLICVFWTLTNFFSHPSSSQAVFQFLQYTMFSFSHPLVFN